MALIVSTPRCIGEYVPCDLGDCVLDTKHCGQCGAKMYRCPLSDDCFASPSDYARCPKLSGTHLDTSLPPDARLEYLVEHSSLQEQISQLKNSAQQLSRLGVPAYQ